MGNGIAQVAATSGFEVVMIDINQEAVDRGMATIERSLNKLVQKALLLHELVQGALNGGHAAVNGLLVDVCLLYTSPSPRD